MLGSGDGDGGEEGGEDLDSRILAIALPALGALAIDPLLGVVCLPTPENAPLTSPCLLSFGTVKAWPISDESFLLFFCINLKPRVYEP